ncbi:cysteine-rich DPF motif domain-containing protein 1 isoform X2 [Ischnura elegans]|uniref:cysteine-rich DPF motif domain-containing protein 1 isoform X2 n=1 Tax=Ischnura elegans TaxID=197161 RepID=UPI001ED8B1EA|nr:cysteine-rich DPF motif domain-containing protein 1 isoform X2 [Ischnura elegans]
MCWSYRRKDRIDMEEKSAKVAEKNLGSHTKDKTVKQEEEEPLGTFTCYSCGLEEHYHYKGKHSPFSTSIEFVDSSYVMKDPFSPRRPSTHYRKQRDVNEPFLILGGDCFSCKRPVCRDLECSVFYKHYYCLSCALKSMDVFPAQMQKKLKLSKSQR